MLRFVQFGYINVCPLWRPEQSTSQKLFEEIEEKKKKPNSKLKVKNVVRTLYGECQTLYTLVH